MSAKAAPQKPASAHADRREQSARQILQSSGLRLVAEHGLDQVSVEQILSAAGYSRRTFYGYFQNKLELLASALNPALEEGALLLETVCNKAPDDLLTDTVDCYLTLWDNHRDALIAIASLSDPSIAPYIETSHRKFGGALQRVLRKAAEAGMLRNRDALYSFKVISRTAVPLLKIYDAHPDGLRLYRESMLALLQAPDTGGQ